MAGGVEEVDGEAVVVELEDGGGDGDAALTLELHPVGGGGALVLAGGDGAGKLEGTAVEEELLGEGGLAGVGVGYDGKGAPARHLCFQFRMFHGFALRYCHIIPSHAR